MLQQWSILRGWRTHLSVLLTGSLLGATSLAMVGPIGLPSTPQPKSKPASSCLREIDKWKVRTVRQLPETVDTLLIIPQTHTNYPGNVLAGTSPMGGIFRFNPLSKHSTIELARGLGDRTTGGTCCVNRLAVRDLDHDGVPELLATTSQIEPRGRPRLYIWSLESSATLPKAMARPAILSSWSHGLAFEERPGSGGDSAFVTFCGFGEVVEYRFRSPSSDDGFSSETPMTWKVVGQLPASGEWMESADVDNDGRLDLAVATGYAEKGAEIRVYASDGPGTDLRLTRAIDEGRRFGNVRFAIGDIRGDGQRDLIAWWRTDHVQESDCEVILYRLDSQGIRRRESLGRGRAADLWPDDGQSAVLDLDGDQVPEIWFATRSGRLWRCEPARSPRLIHVLDVAKGIGPIVGGVSYGESHQSLFFGSGDTVLRLDWVKWPKAPAE